jgi:hypothetical protein
MALYTPKADVYATLQTLQDNTPDLVIYQVRPEVLTTFPCLTFQISDNSATLELVGDIGEQNIEVTINIYANTSKESGELLIAVEGAMRGEGYKMISSFDVPDEDMISHIVTRFSLVY